MNTTPRKYYEGCADLGGTSNEEYKLDNGLGTVTVYSTTPSGKKLTPMGKMLRMIDNKLTAGHELGYDDNHEGIIQLKSMKDYATSLLPEEREMFIDGCGEFGNYLGVNDDDFNNYFTNNYQQ